MNGDRKRLVYRLVGTAAGIASFLIWLAGIISHGDLFWNFFPSFVILGHILAAGILGGSISTLIALAYGVPLRSVRSVAVEAGITAGLTGSLVTAAAIVIAVSLRAFAVAQFPTPPNFYPLLVSLMSILPGMLSGLLAALLTALVRLPAAFSRTALIAEGEDQKESSSRIIQIIFSLFLISAALSPLLPLVKPRPSFPPIRAPESQAAGAPTPKLPPPFAYAKPQEFSLVDPSRWHISEIERVNNLLPTSPLSISPDGTKLAYCASENGQKRVIVLSLFSLERDIGYDFGENAPEHLAWSPDGKRLFYVLGGNEPGMGVLDLSTNRPIALPVGKIAGFPYPEGLPRWWASEEVLFKNESNSLSWLSLDTLVVSPIDDSPTWKNLSDEERRRTREDPIYTLPSTENWNFSFVEKVNTYREDTSSEKIKTESSVCLALLSRKSDYVRAFPQIDISRGDLLLAAPDGSIVVRVRQNAANVFYFTIREKPIRSFALSVPSPQDEHTLKVITDFVTKKTLRGFICAPVVNPLNNKTVAADRSIVRGTVSFNSWEGTSAKASLLEDYFPLAPSDVIADFHYIDSGTRNLVSADVMNITAELSPSQETPKGVGEEENKLSSLVSLHSKEGAVEFVEIRKPPTPPPAPTTAEVKTEVRPSPLPTPSVLESDTGRVREFILHHHRKASANDVSGLVSDYADFIEYFNKGVISPQWIQKDEELSHSKWEVTEVVLDPVDINEIKEGQFEVRYKVRYELKGVDGRRTGGVSDNFVVVSVFPQGLKITKQSAVAHKQY